jgi:uncharacterized protein
VAFRPLTSTSRRPQWRGEKREQHDERASTERTVLAVISRAHRASGGDKIVMSMLLEHGSGEGFEALSEEECFDLLHRESFGRVALAIGGVPAVFPVNYRAFDRAIYFKSGPGVKLQAAIDASVVAFEIDGIEPRYHHGWSVLAVGVAQLVEEPAVRHEIERDGLRPWAPGDRENVLRIVPDFVSGRRITFSPIPSSSDRS